MADLVKKLLKAYALFSVANVCWKLYKVWKEARRANKLWKHLPGKDIDLSGVSALKLADEIHDYMAEETAKFPDAPLVKLPMPAPWLLCNTPESIKWLLKDEFASITKSGDADLLFEMMNMFLGKDGIFVLQHGDFFPEANEMWYKERKVASKIFTKSNFTSMFYKTFVEKATNVLKRLERDNGKEVDMQELFFSFTMDSIEKFFMGTDVNTVEGEMSEYARSFDQAHNSMTEFVKDNILLEVLNRAILPYPFGCWTSDSASIYTLASKVTRHFSSEGRKFKAAMNVLDGYVKEYVQLTRNDPSISERKDIIANFLNSSMGDELTNKQLRDIVVNLTIAGRDTTACTLTWLFFELSINPEIQKELQKELDEKLQGRVPTLEDLEPASLPYLNGVLYEALRLHPPVATNQKTAECDVTYIDGTLIPKGTTFFYSPYALGRNPQNYPDPLEFKPERWIPFNQPSLFEFPVFQAGPRFCLGKDMAIFEAKLLTVMIMQKFSFTLKEGERENTTYAIMLTLSLVNSLDRSTANLWLIPRARA